MKINVNDLFLKFKELPEVEAIALGGSRATGRNDETSDYDVYIYISKPIEESIRKNILTEFCKYMEISNTFWELEDDVTLKDNIDMDIIYRNFDDFKNIIESVVENHIAYNGYTTCMWHNLITSTIIFDKTGRLTTLKERFSISYPRQLKENIINKNLSLLSGMLPSFDKQIKKAEERNDYVSVNHRVTEFLASYFDIIFALNEMTHPGEKRMQSICSKECKVLPNNFDENLNKLFEGMFKTKISPVINDIYCEISKICTLK